MTSFRIQLAFGLLLSAGTGLAQEITPEPPETPPTQTDDVTIELVYVGVSKSFDEKLNAQGYAAYGPDDEIGLAIADLNRAISKGLRLGGRYVYLGSNAGSDQHSVWAYLNAETYLTKSWRIDTRQVVEHRFDTSGVSERTRFRPRFRVSYFGDLKGRGYQLYASVEPIFNLTDDNDDQTSWAAGGFVQLGESIQLNAFYQLTDTERGPDVRFPGIGVLFSY